MTDSIVSAATRVDPATVSTVYGPVKSWRVGASLGIDLLCVNSICSFNCSYCQLGSIQVRIDSRHVFVSTEKVMADLEASDWQSADIITFSGNGEPTLALNLGEVIERIKARTGKPTLVLTNGTLLHREDVRSELLLSDRVYVKLDSATEAGFIRVNRPVPGVTLEGVVESAVKFRELYQGVLGVQIMFLPGTRDTPEDFAALLKRIRPDEVQVNTPTRPYPDAWYLDSRGSHDRVEYPSKPLKPISRQRLIEIQSEFARLLPGIPIRGVRVSS